MSATGRPTIGAALATVRRTMHADPSARPLHKRLCAYVIDDSRRRAPRHAYR